MSINRFLRLPSGQLIRPFMIGGMKPDVLGVVLVDTSNKNLGIIEIDDELYDAENLKPHIISLLEACCEQGKNFKQIDWDEAFNSFKR